MARFLIASAQSAGSDAASDRFISVQCSEGHLRGGAYYKQPLA